MADFPADIEAPAYQGEDDTSFRCRICGTKLRRGETGLCSRPECNDEPDDTVLVGATTFGSDGVGG